MNRSDLISALADKHPHLPHVDVELVVKSILDEMAKCLSAGDRIEIRGFGSFEINQRNPRVARNPRTGEKVIVPEKRTPHFKAGLVLRKRVDASTAKSK